MVSTLSAWARHDRLPLLEAESLGTWMSRGITLYLLLIVAGALALNQRAVMVGGNRLNPDRAIFAAANAATLTGFQQATHISQYLLFGKIVIFLLTISGTLLSLIFGGVAVARLLRLPISNWRIVRFSIGLLIVMTLIGGAALIAPARGVFEGAFQAVSALGNSGFYLGRLPDVSHWATHGILMPLALIGGLGVVIIIELWDAVFGQNPLSRHACAAIWITAAAFLISVAVLAVFQWPEKWTAFRSWKPALILSSITSINTRSAGFPFPFASFTRPMQWLVMLLMMVGACSGGVAGGIKLTTLLVLTRGIRRTLSGQAAGRIFGVAVVWLFTYGAIVVATLFGLLATQQQMPADRILFLAVSAASNVGLSHDPVSMSSTGLLILSGTMLLGRFVPLLILWWAATTADDADMAVG